MKPTSAEFQLTVECCKWAFAGGDALKICEPPDTIDWSLFTRLVRFHRVQGLVWNCLLSTGTQVRADVAHVLASDARSIISANLRLAVEARDLRSCFDRAGVALLFVKGLAVAALAYPKPMLKMGWDIDLLIDSDQLAPAVELLRARGYRQVVPRPTVEVRSWHRRRKESVWTRDPGLHVELHTRLADNVRLIPEITVRSPQQLVDVMPGIALPTLAEEELFAYLCVHGASSAWFRLKWITDLAALLNSQPPAEIERLYRRSQQFGSGRAAEQALILADDLYGVLRGGDLRPRLERDPKSRLLAAAAFRQVAGNVEAREPTEALLGTARIHWTQLLLRPGVGFKASEIVRQIADSIA